MGIRDKSIQLDCIFSGRVQGVGFRATTQQIALRLGLAGFVRNLRDGTVELKVQGSSDAVEALMGELKQEFPLCQVVSQVKENPDETFDTFQVKPTGIL